MFLYGLVLFVYISFLSGVIYFDLRYYKIPDWMTLPAIVLFILYCILKNCELWDIIIRIASSGGMLLIVGFLISFLLKKDTIGGGDIKLITAVGLYKGWQEALLIIFLGSFSALISTLVLVILKKQKMDENIPFGFYVAVSGIFYEGIIMVRGM